MHFCWTMQHLCVLSRQHFQWNQPPSTHWGSWLQLLMAWGTGVSLKTKCLIYLRYSVSWFVIPAVLSLVLFFIFLKKNTINLTGFTSPSATLDSAVTVGRYGAKNFLLRDGKEVVQCVFYENVSRGKKFKQMWLECKMSFTGTVWFTIQKRKVKPLSWSVATYCNFKI